MPARRLLRYLPTFAALALVSVLSLASQNAWAGTADPTSFPFFGGGESNSAQALLTAFNFQWIFFSGFSGAGTGGVGALYYMAITATLIGAILIVINKKYQDAFTIGTWFVLVLIMVFAPYNSRMLFYPLIKPAAADPAGNVAGSGTCQAGSDANVCGFTPQVVAAHMGSTLALLITDVMMRGQAADLAAKSAAIAAFNNDPNLVPRNISGPYNDWKNACSKTIDAADAQPIPLQLKSDGTSTPSTGDAAYTTFGKVLSKINTNLYSNDISPPPAIVIPQLSAKPATLSDSEWAAYKSGVNALRKYFSAGPDVTSDGGFGTGVQEVITKVNAQSTQLSGSKSNLSPMILLNSYITSAPEGSTVQSGDPTITSRNEYYITKNGNGSYSRPATGAVRTGSSMLPGSKSVLEQLKKDPAILAMPVLQADYSSSDKKCQTRARGNVAASCTGTYTAKVGTSPTCANKGDALFEAALNDIGEKNNVSFQPLLTLLRGSGDTFTTPIRSQDLCTPRSSNGGVAGVTCPAAETMAAFINQGGENANKATFANALINNIKRNAENQGVAGIPDPANTKVGSNSSNILMRGWEWAKGLVSDGIAGLGMAVAGGIGYFIGNVMGNAILAIVKVLAQAALMGIIVMTPFIFIMGLLVPSNAAGMLTVTILSVFILKFYPATIAIINFTVNTVNAAQYIGNSDNTLMGISVQGLLMLVQGLLAAKVLSLTFWIMFKMGDTNNLRAITSLEDSAGKIADAGAAALAATAAIGATAIAGGIAAAQGGSTFGSGMAKAMGRMGIDKLKSTAGVDSSAVKAAEAAGTPETPEDKDRADALNKNIPDDKLSDRAKQLRSLMNEAETTPMFDQDGNPIFENGKQVMVADKMSTAASDLKWNESTGEWMTRDLIGDELDADGNKAFVSLEDMVKNRLREGPTLAGLDDYEGATGGFAIPATEDLETAFATPEMPAEAGGSAGRTTTTQSTGADSTRVGEQRLESGNSVKPEDAKVIRERQLEQQRAAMAAAKGETAGDIKADSITADSSKVADQQTDTAKAQQMQQLQTQQKQAATTATDAGGSGNQPPADTATSAGASGAQSAANVTLNANTANVAGKNIEGQRPAVNERKIDANQDDEEWLNKSKFNRFLRGAWSGAIGSVAATGAASKIPGIGQVMSIIGEVANEGTEAPIRAKAFWKAGKERGNSGMTGLSYWKAMKDAKALGMYKQREGILAGAAQYNSLKDNGHTMSGWDNSTNAAIQVAARSMADAVGRSMAEQKYGKMEARDYYTVGMLSSMQSPASIKRMNFAFEQGLFDATTWERERIELASGGFADTSQKKQKTIRGFDAVLFHTDNSAIEQAASVPLKIQEESSVHERKMWDRREDIELAAKKLARTRAGFGPKEGGLGSADISDPEYDKSWAFIVGKGDNARAVDEEIAFFVDEHNLFKPEFRLSKNPRPIAVGKDEKGNFIYEEKRIAIPVRNHRQKAQKFIREKVRDSKYRDKMVNEAGDAEFWQEFSETMENYDVTGSVDAMTQRRESHARQMRMKKFSASEEGRLIARMQEMKNISDQQVNLAYAKGIVGFDPTIKVLALNRQNVIENPISVLTNVLSTQKFKAEDIQQSLAELIHKSADSKLFKTFKATPGQSTDMNAQAINKKVLDQYINNISKEDIRNAIRQHLEHEMNTLTKEKKSNIFVDDGETYIALDRAPYDPDRTSGSGKRRGGGKTEDQPD